MNILTYRKVSYYPEDKIDDPFHQCCKCFKRKSFSIGIESHEIGKKFEFDLNSDTCHLNLIHKSKDYPSDVCIRSQNMCRACSKIMEKSLNDVTTLSIQDTPFYMFNPELYYKSGEREAHIRKRSYPYM